MFSIQKKSPIPIEASKDKKLTYSYFRVDEGMSTKKTVSGISVSGREQDGLVKSGDGPDVVINL